MATSVCIECNPIRETDRQTRRQRYSDRLMDRAIQKDTERGREGGMKEGRVGVSAVIIVAKQIASCRNHELA